MALHMNRKTKFTLFVVYAAVATLALVAGFKRDSATLEELEFVVDQSPPKQSDAFDYDETGFLDPFHDTADFITVKLV